VTGIRPAGRLLSDEGYIYGVAGYGGPGGHGVIYRIDPDGVFQLVYAYCGADGGAPAGGLVKKDGLFFGVTQNGGNSEAGPIGRLFQLNVRETINEPSRWDGLIRTTTDEPAIIGRSSINLSDSGSFSLVLRIDRHRIRTAGTLRDGSFTKRGIVTPGGNVDLILNRLASGRVHGRISNQSLDATFDHVPVIRGGFRPWLGMPNFKLALSASDSASDSIRVWATTRRRGIDRATFFGVLPDGTPFSAGFQVGHDRDYGIYVSLSGGAFAQLAGTLHTSTHSEGAYPTTKRIPGSLGWRSLGSNSDEIRLQAFNLR
jgi:uncharacterized repeat protein (TIGR03803 family)